MHQAVKRAWKACVQGIRMAFTGLMVIAIFSAMILPHVHFLIRLPGMSWEDSQVAMLFFSMVVGALCALFGGATYPSTEATED